MDPDTWREVIEHISVTCASREFRELSRRLEQLYRRAGVQDATFKAYEDALVSMLADNAQGDPLPH